MYQFNLELSIYDSTGLRILEQDVTGKNLSTIKKVISENVTGEGFSGGLTGSFEDNRLDSTSLANVQGYDLNSFTDFLLSCENEALKIPAGETALMYFLA